MEQAQSALSAILDDLNADHVRSTTEHIVSNYPSRLAGSTNAQLMAEFSASALRDVGLAADVHTIYGLGSFPGEAKVAVVGSNTVIAAATLGHSVQTSSDGLVAELVYVGSGGLRDYVGIDVTGKVILTELSYSPARHEKQRLAALNGAVGCVMMNWGDNANEAIPFGSVKSVWGNPTIEVFANEMPTLPCVGISRKDGLSLKSAMASGAVLHVNIKSAVRNDWMPMHFTTGKLEQGSCASRDFVLLGGHQDSWFGPCATDNAIGTAVMVELCRVFAKHKKALRRDIRVGFWTAHETGTMVSSAWYADKYWDELDRHAVAYVQIDQPACLGTTCWETSSNPELRAFHQAIEQEALSGREISWHAAPKIGDASFFGIGVPMMTGQGGYTKQELIDSAQAVIGWWHHSLANTIDKIEWDYVPTHLEVYAKYLWRLCTEPILPMDFRPVAERIKKRIEMLSEPTDCLNVQSLVRLADGLIQHTEELEAKLTSLRQAENIEVQVSAANACLKQLSRILIPLTSTAKGRYGHDPYGHSSQRTFIPSLFQAEEIYELERSSSEFVMRHTHFLRQRNRVADALKESCHLIERTLLQID